MRVSNKIGYSLIVFCLVFFVMTLISLSNEDESFRERVQQKIKVQSVIAASEIYLKLKNVQVAVERFKEKVEQLDDLSFVESNIYGELAENDDIFSLSVAFKPYYYQPDIRYYAPYYERFSGQIKDYKLVDYDKPFSEFNWFSRPQNEGGVWTEPYYERENDVLMTTYSVPFVSKKDKLLGRETSGVVPSDISLEILTHSLKELDLGLGGYSMVFSAKRSLLSHPVFSFVQERSKFSDLVEKDEFKFLNKIQQCFEPDLKYEFFNGETMNNGEHYAACVKIPETNWVLITRMSADMFQTDKTSERQTDIQLVGWLAAALLILILTLYDNNAKSVSKRNMSVSAVLFITSLLIIVIARMYPSSSLLEKTSISNFAQRAAFVDNYQELSEKIRSETPTFVPTGLFIESIEFLSAHNVNITGSLWQRYEDTDEHLEKHKVNFPLAIEQSITETYRDRNHYGELIIGYEFNVTLRHNFEYKKYPFDNKDIELQIEFGDLSKNVMLVPDLESFSILGKKDNPAILDNIVLEEWELSESYFNYKYKHNKTNYGVDKHRALEQPIFTYTIHLEREFISPFVTALLPVLVMVCLLYASIVSMPHTEYGELRNNMTAVIFTILLAHYSIREHLQIDEVIYLEMFYFLLYIVASVFLYLSHKFNTTLDSPDINNRYKVLAVDWYWPVLNAMILLITIITFY